MLTYPRRLLGTPCLSVLLAAAAAAQTQVIPADFAQSGAPSSTAWPFGLSTPCRLQYLYGAAETGLKAPMVIRSINVRGNETSTNVAKSNVDLQLTLSTTTTTVGTASTTFASNHGANQMVVYTRKLTSVNATVPMNPGQYGGPILFDTPFIYDPAAGNLLIDFDIQSQPAGAWAHDTPYTTAGTHAAIGTACNGLGGSSTGGALGGVATFTLTGGQQNGIAVHLLGFNRLPQPIPIPGNPGCELYNDINVLSVVNLTATGTGTISYPVPAQSNLRDAVVFGQYGAINAAFNVDMSQSRQVTLRSWVVLRVHNTSNNASPTGTVQNYVGIVIELSS